MNILPKKSWHVRTKANIERVRRDEEKAAQEEKEKQRRIALAEQEARTTLLRKKAEKRQAICEAGSSAYSKDDGQLSLTSQGSKHINFFSNIEEAERHGANKEYEAEKKEEKEKQEKAIGLLTYLGQSAVEAQTSKPWYFKPPETSKKRDQKDSRISTEEFDAKTKSKLDPMKDMVRYLDKKRKADGSSMDDLDFYHQRKKHKKHKEKERERTKSSGSSSGKSLEQLRAERLRREKEERLKQERLLAKVRGEKLPEEKEEVFDDRSRRYNQQYNPDLARRPKAPRDYTDYRD